MHEHGNIINALTIISIQVIRYKRAFYNCGMLSNKFQKKTNGTQTHGYHVYKTTYKIMNTIQMQVTSGKYSK